MAMTDDAGERSIGTLGSELTFAGQATAALRVARPGLGEPTYLPTMNAVVEAILAGTIDAGVLTSETSHTAMTDTVTRMLAGDPIFVVDEIVVPYHCALLGKPGTSLSDVRHVGGHGSIRQCQRFLAERLPGVEARMHSQNSVVAAREVLAGDGSLAVIGTEAAARALGLEVIERDIDDGALGGWWLLAAALELPAGADLIAVKVDGGDELNAAIDRLFDLGLVIRSVSNAATGELFGGRYLLVLRTADGAPLTSKAIEAFGPNVVGVFASTTAS